MLVVMLVVSDDASAASIPRRLRCDGRTSAMTARYTTLRLELGLDDDPVNGRVSVAGGQPRDFTGYVGLIAELQSIRAEEAARAASQASAQDRPLATVQPEGPG
jgi:hypothetical protein